MTEVSKSQLAKEIERDPSVVTKYVKKGILDGCFTPNGKKIYLEKALKAITDYKGETENETPNASEAIYSGDNKSELDALLLSATSSSQKVQITKDFWLGKINRQKFLQTEGDLITVEMAKGAVEKLLSPLNQYLNDQANSLKNHFPDVEVEVVSWIVEENNRWKEQLRGYDWEV